MHELGGIEVRVTNANDLWRGSLFLDEKGTLKGLHLYAPFRGARKLGLPKTDVD